MRAKLDTSKVTLHGIYITLLSSSLYPSLDYPSNSIQQDTSIAILPCQKVSASYIPTFFRNTEFLLIDNSDNSSAHYTSNLD
jgi:hypothetical protein